VNTLSATVKYSRLRPLPTYLNIGTQIEIPLLWTNADDGNNYVLDCTLDPSTGVYNIQIYQQ
jgi:hypothetical protein